MLRQWCGNQSAGTKTANGNPSDQATAVRKPFDKHGDGNNVTEAKASAAEHSEAKIKPPKPLGGLAGEKNS